jgi:hypothetical protein
MTECGDTLHLKANEAIVGVVNIWHYGKVEVDVPGEISFFCWSRRKDHHPKSTDFPTMNTL